MKKTIYLLMLFSSISLIAQKDINNDGINLGAYIPEQIETIPSYARSMLQNKLNQIITKNGISDNGYNSRFIITPNITVLSKNITATAPPKVALNLEVTFYIGDGIAGKLFSSETVQIKGVGTNETKAYMAALRQIKPKNALIQDLISKGKERIIEYYNNNCDLITKQANTLASQNKFEEALAVMVSVPEVSTCFNKVESKINTLYIKAINAGCARKLNEAKSIWAANQNLDAANQAGAILATIEPEATCFEEVKALYTNIAERIRTKELLDRDWEYKLRVLDLKKTAINAARDVGVAYARYHRHYVVYKVRRWYYY
ncbi:MAG: hypothetical protein GXO84_10755 [Chlorobi bacterium]|nr:hypothetical protein [Chlorobiota bacterium]